jgi:D-alanyl-lipoteichoic acid acyltransferase DltB (MBOAT superfamily)
MLFNSIDFAVFLPIVFLLYWFVTNTNLKAQNLLIVFASYFFYGWWDWRFLSLIIFSTIVDYSIGYLLADEEKTRKRKLLLWISIIVNLGFLGFFKYYNFFLENFIEGFSLLGVPFSAGSLSIILPVGISFYTFQTLSYTIDVYKRKLEPTKDFIAFAAFVSFFPQLVAGPIERATNLLPQFYKKRHFDYRLAVDGLQQVLWGLFKKIVIADNAALYVNQIFENYDGYSGSTLLLGGIFFAFQIYGDFSGYSDIAIGISRLFGFNLMQNFAFPYFSRDIAEFWRRWHISLSTWFRDYLYIPLGGSKGGVSMKIRNTFIIFLVSGFWHGANWTFVVWGFINACYFLPVMLLKQNRKNIGVVAEGKYLPNLRELFQIGFTFFLTVIAWIFFRADSLSEAFKYLKRLFSSSLFSISTQDLKRISFGADILYYIGLLLIFIVIEWLMRNKQHGLQLQASKFSRPIRWIFYYLIGFAIFWFGASQQDFIYFQF